MEASLSCPASSIDRTYSGHTRGPFFPVESASQQQRRGRAAQGRLRWLLAVRVTGAVRTCLCERRLKRVRRAVTPCWWYDLVADSIRQLDYTPTAL